MVRFEVKQLTDEMILKTVTNGFLGALIVSLVLGGICFAAIFIVKKSGGIKSAEDFKKAILLGVALMMIPFISILFSNHEIKTVEDFYIQRAKVTDKESTHVKAKSNDAKHYLHFDNNKKCYVAKTKFNKTEIGDEFYLVITVESGKVIHTYSADEYQYEGSRLKDK